MNPAPRLKLDRAAVARLVDDLAPGSTLSTIRSLRGGARRRVFNVRWRDAAGVHRRIVVRLAPERGGVEENARAEFQTLSALHAAGLPVPRPLLVDAEHEYFDHPAIVMEYAGRPVVNPRDRDAWLRRCAETLADLHGPSAMAADLSHLRTSSLDERRAYQEASLTPEHLSQFETDELIGRATEALARAQENQKPVHPRLVHDDYWPGNILWRRDRLSAVIDWTEATLSDPARDVAQFQIDMALMSGLEDAQEFGRLYSAAAGGEPENLRYVQLYGIRSAYAHLEDWYLPGYLDLGMKLTLSMLQVRFRDYIRWVLE